MQTQTQTQLPEPSGIITGRMVRPPRIWVIPGPGRLVKYLEPETAEQSSRERLCLSRITVVLLLLDNSPIGGCYPILLE